MTHIDGSFRRWEAAPGPGTAYGILFLSTAVAWVVLALVFTLMSDGALRFLFGFIALIGSVALAALIVLFSRLRSIGYVLDAEELIVEWSGHRININYLDIRSVVFEDTSDHQLSGYERYWPGFHISSIRVANEEWRSIATLPPDRRIRVYSTSGMLAISPEHPVLFLQELADRRRRAEEHAATGEDIATQPEESMDQALPADPLETGAPYPETSDTVERPTSWVATLNHIFRQKLLGDPIASNLLATGVIILVLMTVYSVWRIDGSFTGGPIHWNALGEPDVFVSARGGWIFVLIAGTVLVINTAVAMLCTLWDQFVTRLLLASSIAVQILLALALLNAIN